MCPPTAAEGVNNLDRDMAYAVTHDAGWDLEDCDNCAEVRL